MPRAWPLLRSLSCSAGLFLGDGADQLVAPDGPGRAALARLVPEIERQPATELRRSTSAERLQLFHAVLDLFGTCVGDRPLIVLVEDLHWADASSLDLLRFIAAEMTKERLLIIGTFRTDEVQGGHPLLPFLGEVARLPHVMRVDLPAFSATEVADQLEDLTGSRPTDDVVQRVLARSDGNPFFVEELARDSVDARLPATLRDILAARLATLSATSRRTVLAAAAVGREAPHALIAQVTEIPHERLLESLHEAIDHHVLVQAGSDTSPAFAFRHALIQEAAYAELLPSERIALHMAIVASLEAAGGSPAEIARHAFLGADMARCLAWSVAAADDAHGALAFAEALGHAERALELWSGISGPKSHAGRDEGSVWMLAARSAAALGRWRRAADLGRATLAHLDPIGRRDERIRLLLDLSEWEAFADDPTARAVAIREAAELVPNDAPSALLARVLTSRSHLAAEDGRVDEAQHLATEAVQMSRAIGAGTEEGWALLRLAELLCDLQPDAADRLLAEAVQVAADRDADFDDLASHLVFRQADIALAQGAFARAIKAADAGVVRAARAGRSGQLAAFLRVIKIEALGALGRWDEAEILAVEAGRDTEVMTARMATQGFVAVLIRQGRIAEASAAVQATDFGYVTPHEGTVILSTRIRVANGEGRWDEARAAAQEGIGLFYVPASHPELSELVGLAVVGEADRAELARGRRRKAEEADARRVGLARLELLRGALGYAIRRGDAGARIQAELATAEAEGSRLKRRSDAKLWDDVAMRREALGQPWEIAYAQFRQAEAILVTPGPKQDALPMLREAHRIASQLGAWPLVDQIEGLARRARIRLVSLPPRQRARTGTTPEGVVVTLTTREREVLSLVAAGHTNREIGEELFISEKTASVHVSNAMDKLGALSRYEAAAIATRLGLLESFLVTAPTAEDLGRRNN